MKHRFEVVASITSLILVTILCSASFGQEGEKVAVLYFTDSSKFDSGGGCLTIWPLNIIFGSGEKKEEWDLKSGFRDMLNDSLTEAGFKIIEAEYVDNIIKEVGTEDTATLSNRLDADIMIIGNIKKFEQHRTRASSQGPTTMMSGEGMKLAAMGGIGGYFYSSTVKTNITIYDNLGDERESEEVNSKRNLRDFYMGVGLMTYHKGDTKEAKGDEDPQNPIVDYKKLDKMKIGSDEFKNRTLFGMATMDVMNQVVDKVGEYLEPIELATVEGKIIYVGTGERLKEGEVYVNIGASDGIRVGHKLGIFTKALQLTDPDTGEDLGSVPEKEIGTIKISKIEAEHLSIAEIIEKTGDIERGNIIKRK